MTNPKTGTKKQGGGGGGGVYLIVCLPSPGHIHKRDIWKELIPTGRNVNETNLIFVGLEM